MCMGEMIYSEKRINPPEVIFSEAYFGYTFYILSMGTHPCAYIQIPKNDKLFGMDYDDIENKYELNVHGGLTYTNSKLKSVESEGWFIGWDYAHWGDYIGYADYSFEDKKWDVRDIRNECENVIEQIVKINM